MSNWWAQRLNQGAAPAAPVPAPTRPYQAPASYQRPAPMVQQPTRLPPSARETEECPGCGSGNYMAAPGSQYHRCLDCGYPIVQSGSGVGTVHSDAPVRAAVQVPSDGYHPQQIIGRVE